MKFTIYQQSIITLIILSSLISMPISPTSGYVSNPSIDIDTHDQILDQALVVLNGDSNSHVVNEMSPYLDIVKQASYEADDPFFFDPSTHFMTYNHEPLVFWLDSAGSLGKKVYQEAIIKYQNGDISGAYYDLGIVLHLLADVTVPHHATNNIWGGHRAYESFISNLENGNYQNSNPSYSPRIPTVTYGGIYDIWNYRDHYDDLSAFGYIDNAVHFSDGYFSSVSCNEDINTGKCPINKDADYYNAANQLLPKAVKLTAGLMKLFFDTTRSFGDVTHYLQGSISEGSSISWCFDLPYNQYNVFISSDQASSRPKVEMYGWDVYEKDSCARTSYNNFHDESPDATEHNHFWASGAVHIKIYGRYDSDFKISIIPGIMYNEKVEWGYLYSSGAQASYPMSGQYSYYYAPPKSISHIFLSGPDNSDFDLYTKFSSRPTRSSYDCRGFTGSSLEKCTINRDIYGGTLFVTADSWSGTGRFVIMTAIFKTYN